MVKINILIMVSIALIALVAVSGMASAKLTLTVNSIQANGHYIGVPTIINGETYTYGYNYTFIPDGTYTVSGTLFNDADTVTHAGILILSGSNVGTSWLSLYVPAAAGGN